MSPLLEIPRPDILDIRPDLRFARTIVNDGNDGNDGDDGDDGDDGNDGDDGDDEKLEVCCILATLPTLPSKVRLPAAEKTLSGFFLICHRVSCEH